MQWHNTLSCQRYNKEICIHCCNNEIVALKPLLYFTSHFLFHNPYFSYLTITMFWAVTQIISYFHHFEFLVLTKYSDLTYFCSKLMIPQSSPLNSCAITIPTQWINMPLFLLSLIYAINLRAFGTLGYMTFYCDGWSLINVGHEYLLWMQSMIWNKLLLRLSSFFTSDF